MTDDAAAPAGLGTPGDLPLWQRIRHALAGDLDARLYPPGAKLPTEAELARRFGANRHTVRRALDALRQEGRIHVRRGSGAVVTQGRFDYAIGARTRFSRNLTELGHTPGRTLLRCEEVPAAGREADALGLEAGDPVVVAEAVAAADGVPILYSRSFYPAGRLAGIAAALRIATGITDALARVGVADYQRRSTRLVAEMPEALIARHLRMSDRAPVLRAESVNVDADGVPVEYGISWFCSDRIALVVDRSSFS